MPIVHLPKKVVPIIVLFLSLLIFASYSYMSLAQTNGNISGYVYDAADGVTPLENINVNVQGWGSSCTDVNGYYIVTNIPFDTPYRVAAGGTDDYGHGCADPGTYIREYWDESDWNNATQITLTSGNPDQTLIDFTLETGTIISGIVTETDGVTPIQAYLEAFPVNGNGPEGFNANADGTYTVVLAPGDYTLRARADGYAMEFYNDAGTDSNNGYVFHVESGVPIPGINFSLDPGGTISGVVYAVDNVTTLENVQVELLDGTFGVCTDANGAFSFPSVPLDTPYLINARGGCGSTNYLTEWWEETPDQNSATPIVLTAIDPDQGGFDFTLSTGGSILGVITESDGTTPIANVWVWVEDMATGQGMNGANSNPDGSYTVSGLPSGTYRVRASAPNYAEEFYDGVLYYGNYNNATPVIVTAGQDTLNIDIALDPGGTISGIIYDAQNNPVGGVPIDTNPGGFGRCSNFDGSYSIEGLPLDVPIIVQAGGSQWGGCSNLDYIMEYWQDQVNYNNANPITLTSGGGENKTDTDFNLEEGGIISGQIFESDGATPVTITNGQVILLRGSTNNWIEEIWLGSNTTYSFGGLAAGDYVVFAIPHGYAFQYYPGVLDFASATPITVTLGNEEIVNFSVNPGGTISGNVTDSNSAILFNASVAIDGGSEWPGVDTCTDESGNYTLSGLPLEMSYIVRAGDSGWCYGQSPGQFMTEWWDNKFSQQEAIPILVATANPDVVEKDFILETGGSISGKVTESDNTTPIPTAQVCVSDFNGQGYGCQSVNGDGTYTFGGLPTGTYRVDAQASGYAREFYGGMSYYANHNDATPVSVTVGQDTPNIDITLDPGGSISGQVIDVSTGLGIPNIRVNVSNDGSNFWSDTCADENGNYMISGLPLDQSYKVGTGSMWSMCGGGPGQYEAEIWEETMYGDLATLLTPTLSTPDFTDIDFTLAIGGTVSGTIYASDGVTRLPNIWVVIEWDGPNVGMNMVDNCTDQNGDYQLSGLSMDVPFRVKASGGNPWCQDNYFEEYWEESPDNGTATILTTTTITPDITGIDFTLDSGGTISGTVTDEITGLPVVGIEVWIPSQGGGAFDCTDQDGNYTISGLPYDTPMVIHVQSWSGCQSGPQDYAPEWYLESATFDAATPVTLTAQSPDATANFTALQQSATVSGTVTDAVSGLGIGSMGIDVNAGDYHGNTCTNPDGTYSVQGVPFDIDVYVTAAQNGNDCSGNPSGYFQEKWEEISDGQGDPIVITSASPLRDDIHFTLEMGGSISGFVYDAIGAPLVANVSANSATTDQWWNVQSNPDGSYILNGLEPGTYRVRAGAQDYANELYSNVMPYYNLATIITVVAGQDEPNINFSLDAGGYISGTVYESDGVTPIPFINVGLDMWLGTCTDADGNYTIGGIPLNTPFKVVVGYNLNNCGGSNLFRLEWWNEATDSESATEITLTTPGETIPNINFTLTTGGTISGFVHDKDTGAPIQGIAVTILDGAISDSTDEYGMYTLGGVPFDTDYPGIHAHNAYGYACESFYVSTNWAGGPIIPTQENPDITGIDFAMPLGGQITGTVYDAATMTSQNFTDGYQVLAEDAVTNNLSPSESYFYGNGDYCITLETGAYYVYANAGATAYVREYYEEAGWLDTTATPVTVNPGVQTPEINFTLETGGTISGTVNDGYMQVFAETVDGAWSTQTCSDGGGNYSIGGIPFDVDVIVYSGRQNGCGGPDNFYVRQYYGGVYDFNSATPIHLTSGTPTKIDAHFTLMEGGTVTGTVSAAEDSSPVVGIWVCALDYDIAGFDEVKGWQCGQTDANGNYTISALSPLDKRIWALPADRLKLFSGNSTTYEGAARVPITLATSTSNSDTNFSPPLAGYITGTVYEEDGTTPYSGGIVISTDSGEYPECVNVNNGQYSINVPVGTHIIRAQAGFCNSTVTFSTQYFNGVADSGSATPVTVSAVGDTVSGIDFTENYPQQDPDADGVSNETENGAPNNGDGNNDGILDSQQDHVTSLPNAVDGQYVTLVSPAGTQTVNVAATTNPSPGDAPANTDFPVGFVNFAIQGMAPGGATTATLLLPAGTAVDTYYKYGPTPGDPTDHWYEFMFDGTTGAEINGTEITLHFVDGQRGDNDLTADGVIIDPGAPAGAITTGPITVSTCDANDLIAAINTANSTGEDDVIDLNGSCTYTLTAPDNNSNGLPIIVGTGTLTINGNGATIARDDLVSQFRILYVDYATLTLDNVTISGGDLIGDGGGIYMYDGILNIVNGSEISNNTVTCTGSPTWDGDGGAIYNAFGTVTITDSTVLNNHAVCSDFAKGNGGAISSGGTLTIERSSLSGNSAFSDGGAIKNSGTLILTDSTISDNSAYNAGAIDSDSSSNVTITNSTLSGNSVDNAGGSIYYYNGSISITNSTFANNMADGAGGAIAGGGDEGVETITITHSTFAGNSSAMVGGALALGLDTVKISSSIFANNTAPSRPNITSAIVSQDYNLIDDTSGMTITGITTHDIYDTTAGIAALADNGGFTETVALLSSSPAIDVIPTGDCAVATDQRGVVRPQGVSCDTGAVEYVPFNCANVTEIPLAECNTLVALYTNTNGDNWANTLAGDQRWLVTNTPCVDWYGITCDAGRVSEIALGGNNLTGVLPAWSMMTALRNIDLADNNLSGNIPDLSNLVNLDNLWLYNNQLTGPIPSLSTLTVLRAMQLQNNQLTGNIPDWSATILETFYLSNNQLDGPIPSFTNLTNLTNLLVDNNQLTGPIPSLTGLTSLREFKVNGNNLTGEIPDLSSLISLQELWLDVNPLSGSIPDLSSVTNLQSLWIGNTQLEGDIPLSFAGLTNLTDFNMAYDMLTASDPAVIALLNSLQPDWAATQTVDVTNLSAQNPTLTSVELVWTPILYMGDGGHYEISTSVNGVDWTSHGQTADKTISSYLVDNIDLTTPLYFRVQTYTPAHGPQPNSLLSSGVDLYFDSATYYGIPLTEYNALVALYTDTGGANWTNTLAVDQPWLVTNTPCVDWYGITCGAGRVVRLELGINNLVGTISDLSPLANLYHLQMNENQLIGSIPVSLSNLSALQYLDLSFNHFSGVIPSQLGGLANLQHLDLGFNDTLTGAIPTELGDLSNLEILYLTRNDLNGSIPPQLGDLSNLREFSAWANHLSGSIPTELGDLSNLEHLNLDFNDLDGSIPPELGNLTNLLTLTLEFNELTGPIPSTLDSLSNLTYLSLFRNHLSGGIPDLSALTKLDELLLNDNQLSGDIPTSLGSLSAITNLDVGYNMLTASDPALITTYLNSRDPDWADTQTIPVTNLAIQNITPDRVDLTWTPIRYVGDSGFYEISYSDDGGTQWHVHGQTADKTTSQYTVDGIDTLLSYQFRVRTHTLANNDLWSDYSNVAVYTSQWAIFTEQALQHQLQTNATNYPSIENAIVNLLPDEMRLTLVLADGSAGEVLVPIAQAGGFAMISFDNIGALPQDIISNELAPLMVESLDKLFGYGDVDSILIRDNFIAVIFAP